MVRKDSLFSTVKYITIRIKIEITPFAMARKAVAGVGMFWNSHSSNRRFTSDVQEPKHQFF